jgi:ABC-type nitrate/sulfonate/bicarbonate transport system substrate-binding protein
MTISDRTFVKPSRRQRLAATGVAATSLAMPWIRKAGAAEIEKVRMASWSPRLAEQANIYVSEQVGFFKEQGIELEWIPGQGSGDALKNMIAGNGRALQRQIDRAHAPAIGRKTGDTPAVVLGTPKAAFGVDRSAVRNSRRGGGCERALVRGLS